MVGAYFFVAGLVLKATYRTKCVIDHLSGQSQPTHTTHQTPLAVLCVDTLFCILFRMAMAATTTRYFVRRGSLTATMMVLMAACCVLVTSSFVAIDSHRDAWRSVINHGRIPAGEDVTVSTKQGTLRGRRIAGDQRAGTSTIRVYKLDR